MGVAEGGAMFSSGGWDNTVKIWSGNMVSETENDGESAAKRSKGGGVTRTPMQTLGGHKEAVSGLVWMDSDTLASASMDHTIKLWDVELGGLKHEMVGNKAFFSVSHNPLSGSLLASSADRSVRMYDPRSGAEQIVTSVFTSHTGWVSRVTWARGSENLFVTSSYDNLVKMWDARSSRTPLYDLSGSCLMSPDHHHMSPLFLGHTDKVLSCDWSNPEYIVSGGADNDMKIFKSKMP